MSIPVVAIVGRPNVGKSTLFNRIVGHRQAIVEDTPGTTRDRIATDVTWAGTAFALVDSGGLEISPEAGLKRKVREQVEAAIAEADLILFLVEAPVGILPADQDILQILHRSGKPVLLVANKVDRPAQKDLALEFYELGIGEPIPVSAYHGKGTEELLDRVVAMLPAPISTPEEAEPMRIAIVGRPNVGKSSLINTMLGEDRLIVHPVPGTTRDAIDTVVDFDGEKVVLVDTAGIRRRGRIERGVEKYSFARAKLAIERSDVSVLLIDAIEGITAQDLHVLGYIQKALKGAILTVNKWDVAEEPDSILWTQVVRQRARFMPYAELLFISAKTGFGVDAVLPAAKRIYEERHRKPSPSALRDMLSEAVISHLPPKKGKRTLRLRRVVQTGVNPPCFVFHVNDPTLVHFSYRRYLENRLRQSFGFEGTPIQLTFKGKREKVGGGTHAPRGSKANAENREMKSIPD